MTRKALGRGLSALIPQNPSTESSNTEKTTISDGKPLKIPIDKIRPNHLQPRRHFDPELLGELASSIKQHGLAQPIVVSFDTVSRSYELIAGERRWRAAQLAGLYDIEAVILQPHDDKQRLALTLIENLQRSDLNPIEIALGYLRLMKEFGINQTQLGAEVGKSKSGISNILRLLDLPEDIQKAIQYGQLTEGHGRALLMIEDPNMRHLVYKKVIDGNLSVREAESLAKQADSGEFKLETKSNEYNNLKNKSADLRSLEESLQQLFGTKISIKTKKNPSKGSVTIHFFSYDDFDRIINIIKK